MVSVKPFKSPKIILDSIWPEIITPFDVYFNQQDLKTLNDGSCGKGINAAKQRISEGYYSHDVSENWEIAKLYYKEKYSLERIQKQLDDFYSGKYIVEYIQDNLKGQSVIK